MRWVVMLSVLSGCVAAVDGGPTGDGAPRAHPTEADATAAQAPELVDQTGALSAPAGCEGLLVEATHEPTPEDTTEARSLYRDGARAFEIGDYPVALDAFCECYRLSAAPALLYNIAVTYERIGMPQQAADHYEAFADRSDDSPMDDEVRARADRLRQH